MSCKWKLSLKELKKVSYVAAPMVAVTVLQYLMQVVSVMMVGHLDELSQSGISSASSFTSVTGFSLLVTTSFPLLIGNCTQFGLAGALEALCRQAYGAEQYQKLRTYTYCAIISLILQQLSSNIEEKNIKLPAMVDNSLSSLMLLGDMIRVLLFCSASGVARGSGWQKFGAYVNLGAYYLVGTPVAAELAFVLHLRAKGFLIGLATRSSVQASLLALRTIFTSWQEYCFNPNNFLLQFDLLLR
ncbi:hypothetical protein POTOM_059350 [Populus tomentosa]|uniref:MATE efflux family protein n=1 Tax=Populus tomentosa TaxID=118781 RepID=A0A8X7XU19_POPTO|nr:hypothetical protein POTOM_059350 [Populus tomentosa]